MTQLLCSVSVEVNRVEAEILCAEEHIVRSMYGPTPVVVKGATDQMIFEVSPSADERPI